MGKVTSYFILLADFIWKKEQILFYFLLFCSNVLNRSRERERERAIEDQDQEAFYDGSTAFWC